MDNNQLLVEIRENRKAIKEIHKDFYLFKGKAFGFISLLSVIVNLAFSYLFKNNP